MPANRSRTFEWRRCLAQIRDRGGAIEIAVTSDAGKEAGDLVWRVRVIDFNDECIVVEQPVALGRLIEFEDGVEMVAFITIGQNRWTFNTSFLGCESPPSSGRPGHNPSPLLRLQLPTEPDAVKRCMRRKHDRLNTSQLRLPRVQVWPLLEPGSTVLAERAVALHFNGGQGGGQGDGQGAVMESPSDEVMPDVGPCFTTTLMNIGGGGVGLLVEPDDSQTIARHSMFWLRLVLPGLSTPICAAGKVVHTHIESTHQTYAGIAFDFTFNPAHQKVVVDQICRYIAMQQRDQSRKSA